MEVNFGSQGSNELLSYDRMAKLALSLTFPGLPYAKIFLLLPTITKKSSWYLVPRSGGGSFEVVREFLKPSSHSCMHVVAVWAAYVGLSDAAKTASPNLCLGFCLSFVYVWSSIGSEI